MTISIVPLTAADRQRLLAVDNAAFFFDPNAHPVDIVTNHLDWSRTFGASREDSDELAGVYTSYDMAVTAPGPLDTVTQLPMAGLSWVSVHPDHRRRGVLRQMITHHFAQVHEQGVALSGLHAAEVGIYGRFGYGVSSFELELELERGAVFTAPSLEDSASRVTTHFVKADSDATAELVHDLHLSCAEDALGALKAEMLALLQVRDRTLHLDARPSVVVVVGVNGSGKTTTLGKLAHRLRGEGLTPLVAAADTFRAAAIDQMRVWADRSGTDVVAHQPGADPGAVVYDAIQAALARRVDVVLVDTAGRLHTKSNLMAELEKVRRVIGRAIPDAPHETLLVIEAPTGMNAMAQARAFHDAMKLTGIVLTKLDGSSRGGTILAIEAELGVPVKLVGMGEGIDDLNVFDPQAYLDALFAGVLEVPAV